METLTHSVSPLRQRMLGDARVVARAQGKMLDGGWLFLGRDPIDPPTARQLNRAIHEATMVAKIDKPVSMHILQS